MTQHYHAWLEYAKRACEWCAKGLWRCRSCAEYWHHHGSGEQFPPSCTAKPLAVWADEIAGELATAKMQMGKQIDRIAELEEQLAKRTKERDEWEARVKSLTMTYQNMRAERDQLARDREEASKAVQHLLNAARRALPLLEKGTLFSHEYAAAASLREAIEAATKAETESQGAATPGRLEANERK